MARIRSADTTPELRLRAILWAAGLRYRLRPRLPGTPDIAFLGPRVAVFVDGCFWHGCPEHYRAPATNPGYWAEKLRRNRNRDVDVDEKLSRLGWRVLRIWEHDVSDASEAKVQGIRGLLGQAEAKPGSLRATGSGTLCASPITLVLPACPESTESD